jgi:hypothetical protein
MSLDDFGVASEYPVLLGYTRLASRASQWFSRARKPRVLDGVSGAARLAAAGSVATASLRTR